MPACINIAINWKIVHAKCGNKYSGATPVKGFRLLILWYRNVNLCRSGKQKI